MGAIFVHVCMLCFVGVPPQGVSAPHIQKVRGMTRSVCISSLISNAPEAQRYIAAGGEQCLLLRSFRGP